MAGRKIKAEKLYLIVNDDFEIVYTWKVNGVPAPYPTGHELYYQFQNGTDGDWSGGTKWPFTITGSTAYCRVESEAARAAIEDRTPYQLIFKRTDETPSLDRVLLQGKVEWVVP